jgi:hypothetical protein
MSKESTKEKDAYRLMGMEENYNSRRGGTGGHIFRLPLPML